MMLHVNCQHLRDLSVVSIDGTSLEMIYDCGNPMALEPLEAWIVKCVKGLLA